MQGVHLRKYGVETAINFELYEVDGVDLRVDAADAGTDCNIRKDQGADATCTNDFVDEGLGYSLTLTATEMEAASITLYIIDSATKVWLDKTINIETYGNASAQHALDLDTALADATIGTCTTNTDMVGTDGAALASVVGALADAAAAGEVTEAETLMQYLKQLINILIGAAGIGAFPAEAAPANAVSLAEVIRAIHVDVTGLNGSAMIGTNGANTVEPDATGTAAGLHTTTDAKIDATDGLIGTAQADLNTITGTGGALIATDAQDLSGTLDVNTKTLTAGIIANATLASDIGSTAHGTNKIALACRKILEELNLDHLLKVTTTVAADGDLEDYVVAGTVAAHLMAAAADATAYKASTDSLEAIKVHADTIKAETAAIQVETTALDTLTKAAGDGDLAAVLGDTNELQADNYPTSIAAVQTTVDAIEGHTGTTGVVLNAAGLDADAVDEILDEEVDNDGTAITLRGAIKLILSVLTGKSSGGGTTTAVFRDINDAKNRISATVDEDGNRTAVGTRDAS